MRYPRVIGTVIDTNSSNTVSLFHFTILAPLTMLKDYQLGSSLCISNIILSNALIEPFI